MAAKEKNVEQDTTITTYDNKSITYTGNLESYDYASILKDKQGNIYKFFELSDYYVDADPMYRGIIKGVYTPFSVSEWKLVGANESVISKYENFYEQIGLADKMWSIFYQYYKYKLLQYPQILHYRKAFESSEAYGHTQNRGQLAHERHYAPYILLQEQQKSYNNR